MRGIWGSTACVIVTVPFVLVSNSSWAASMDVPSSAFSQPIPALLTNTSINPAASTASAMLVGPVTSSASTFSRSDGQDILARLAHGGDDAPVVIEEEACDFEPEAGRAAGDENGRRDDPVCRGDGS